LREQPWQWRGRFASGAPAQSFVEPILASSDDVLVSSIGGGLELRRVRSGQKIWSLPVAIGVASKPLILGTSVVVAGLDAQVRRLNLTTGAVEWTQRISAESTGGIAASGGRLFVSSADDSLWALDEKSGEVAWTYRRPGTSAQTQWSLRGQAVPQVSVDGGRLFLGFSDGYFVALDAQNGQTVWERNFDRAGRFKDADLSPVLSRDGLTLFLPLVDGDLIAVRTSNGSSLWSVPDAGGATPLVDEDEGALYAVTLSGQVQRVSLRTTAVEWTTGLSAGAPSTPVALGARHVVLSTSHEGLAVLDRKSGQVVWRKRYGYGPLAAPAFDGERLLVLSARNRLELFRVEERKPAHGG